MNNERLIAIFFALLIVVGAWRGYQYFAHPDLGPAAEDPASVLDPPRGRDDGPPASPEGDEKSPSESAAASTQSADQANIHRCLENGEVVLSDKPCGPEADALDPIPTLGRDRSDRPIRPDESPTARNRPGPDLQPR